MTSVNYFILKHKSTSSVLFRTLISNVCITTIIFTSSFREETSVAEGMLSFLSLRSFLKMQPVTGRPSFYGPVAESLPSNNLNLKRYVASTAAEKRLII